MDFTFGRRSVVAQIGPGGRLDTPESAADAGRGAAAFSPADEKYERLAPIGSGGMGEVMLVHDRDLRRDVAMKMLREDLAGNAAMRSKFVAEAQATSQLEHPGIPPVHDIGITPQGNIYFTMKVVRGETLAGVIKKLVLGAKDVRQTYTLHRLVSAMERMCEACDFAHEKGVIHRDLKPENVMLGEFGEVHVMDWGIAKVAESVDPETDDAIRTIDTDAALMTQAGTVKGTIPYMSPEQARGEALDRRTDVWALGAILYEILTLHPAFEGEVVPSIQKVRNAEFPDVATRNPRRFVPEALAATCRRAMSRDRSARHATAREFGEELRAWLDGRAEQERRHREAEALAAEGREAMARYAATVAATGAAEAAVGEEDAKVKSWWPIEQKAELVAARRRLDETLRAAALAFAETTRLLDAALVTESDNANARAAFADLWRGRLDDAERRGDRPDTAHALTMVRRYDDGRLAATLAGDGSLELTSDPPGARVTIAQFEERGGVLAPGAMRDLGATPLGPVPLPMGSFLCVLTHPGRRDVRYPVHITRNRAWKGHVELRTDREIGEGFVYVPAGPFIHGEEKDTRTVELPDFAIAARPVTFADWIEFLTSVESQEGLDAARKLVPGTSGDGSFMERPEEGGWRLKPGLASGPSEAKLLARHGPGFETRWPIVGVSWHDAVAWCAWKSKATGREWRLPTEEERQKAARGVDGRTFPWGDFGDATLGKCRESREEPSQPEPVGSFPTATSVYGMIDAAGNSFDWTDSWFDSRAVSRVVHGGSWDGAVGLLRCGYRNRNTPGNRFPDIGFRPARSLTP